VSVALLVQVIAVAAQGDSLAVVTQSELRRDGAPVPHRIPQPVGAAFAPDGGLLVFGGTAGERGLLEFGGRIVEGHADLVMAVAFGPGWIATGSADRTIGLLGPDGVRRRTLEGHTGAVLAVAVSPDGSLLVSGGADATLRVWDPSGGRLLRVLANHGDRVNALAWSPDGRYLASAGRDRTVRIWQPGIGRMVRILPHDAEVLALAWPDELVSASADGKVRVFGDAGLRTLAEHDVGARAVSIAVGKGEILVAAGSVRRLPRGP
jgi:WD40 repeat protein